MPIGIKYFCVNEKGEVFLLSAELDGYSDRYYGSIRDLLANSDIMELSIRAVRHMGYPL